MQSDLNACVISQLSLTAQLREDCLQNTKNRADKTNRGKSGSRTDLEHEFAHGFELFCGIVLPMEQRVIGHLPQLHHHVTQLARCREKARGELLATHLFSYLFKIILHCSTASRKSGSLSPLVEVLSFLKRVW